MGNSYFYLDQSEQFSFLAIPKIFFKKPEYKKMQTEAKVLYALLLERMNLSRKHKWIDKLGRIYIIYTIEEIMEVLGCGDNKAVRLLNELEKKFDLIERKRQGLGRPNLIYVKNFASKNEYIDTNHNGNEHEILPVEQKIDDSDFDNSDPSESSLYNSDFEDSDMAKQRSNYKDFNNLNSNYLNFINPSINQSSVNELNSEVDQNDRVIDEKNEEIENICESVSPRKFYTDSFKLSLDYDDIQDELHKQRYNEIINIMVDVCCSPEETIKINNVELPRKNVIEVLRDLDYDKVQSVLERINALKYPIKNMKQYLIVALYNVGLTYYNDTIAKEYQQLYGYSNCYGEELL